MKLRANTWIWTRMEYCFTHTPDWANAVIYWIVSSLCSWLSAVEAQREGKHMWITHDSSESPRSPRRITERQHKCLQHVCLARASSRTDFMRVRSESWRLRIHLSRTEAAADVDFKHVYKNFPTGERLCRCRRPTLSYYY